jgi:hypothetical protein
MVMIIRAVSVFSLNKLLMKFALLALSKAQV